MADLPIHMTADIRLPAEGITLDRLKALMRSARIPNDTLLKPVVVGNAMDPEDDEQVRLRAEWQA